MCKRLRPYAMLIVAVLSLSEQIDAGSIRVGHAISAAGREREIARNQQLVQRLESVRLRNPARFAQAHPFYAGLLTNPAFFQTYFQRWQAHPARFEYYHPLAWRVLDGKANLDASQSPSVEPVVPPSPALPQVPSLPPETPSTPTPGPLPQQLVPEPSAQLLMLSGAGILLLARAGLRWRRRSSPC